MAPFDDPIARAYAIIGLHRGCTARQLKSQYKRLATQWHPDRWMSDPIAQAEAAQRMRAINDAYALLHASARARAPESPRDADPRDRARDHVPPVERPLTDAEIDDIAGAIGTTPNPVDVALGFLSWIGPLAAGFMTIPRARPATSQDWIFPAICFSIGLAVLVRRAWNSRGRPPDRA